MPLLTPVTKASGLLRTFTKKHRRVKLLPEKSECGVPLNRPQVRNGKGRGLLFQKKHFGVVCVA